MRPLNEWAEGTAMLGTKMEAVALLLTPPAPEGRGPPSLRPKPNPKLENRLRICGADESVVEDKGIVAAAAPESPFPSRARGGYSRGAPRGILSKAAIGMGL